MEPLALDLSSLLTKDDPHLLDQYTFQYWKDRQNRLLYVDFTIGEEGLCLEVAKAILQINFEDKDKPKEERMPIKIILQSCGGDVYQANFLIDVIESSITPVYTIAGAMAMSAAAEILISGHKRYAFKHSVVMIHQGFAQLQGTAEQLDDAAKNYKQELEDAKKYILAHTDIPESLYNKNKKKDWYISGEDLLSLHIVDTIIGENGVTLDEII